MPFPELMAYLAWTAEYVGIILLLLGLAVAGFVSHDDPHDSCRLQCPRGNEWQAIHDPMSAFAFDQASIAVERLDQAKSILQEYGNYSWLTEHGSLVVLNNGIKFASTYFVMLLALFVIGAGRFISMGDWLA